MEICRHEEVGRPYWVSPSALPSWIALQFCGCFQLRQRKSSKTKWTLQRHHLLGQHTRPILNLSCPLEARSCPRVTCRCGVPSREGRRTYGRRRTSSEQARTMPVERRSLRDHTVVLNDRYQLCGFCGARKQFVEQGVGIGESRCHYRRAGRKCEAHECVGRCLIATRDSSSRVPQRHRAPRRAVWILSRQVVVAPAKLKLVAFLWCLSATQLFLRSFAEAVGFSVRGKTFRRELPQVLHNFNSSLSLEADIGTT